MTVGDYVTLGGICVGVLWKMGDMAVKADNWRADEERWGAWAKAVMEIGLRGWAENDVDGARAIVDFGMGGTLHTNRP